MRILTIHRYFWPDTPPYAAKLRRLSEHFAEQGHEVRVFSSQPGYKAELDIPRRPRRERLGPLEVVRCGLLSEKSRNPLVRGWNSVWFCLRLFWHILWGPRYDVILCSTMPPVIGGWATSLAAVWRGSKFVYHVMDIWPEVAHQSGQMGRGWVYRFLQWMETATCLRATRVVCLSGDMRQTYLGRRPELGERIRVINNFELPDYNEAEADTPSELFKPAGKFRVLFAGNLGRYQALDTLLQAARLLRSENNIEFVFLGNGAAKAGLQQSAEDLANVRFLDHLPVAAARELMADADLCVVSLAPGIIQLAYPSKTMTYLSLGCPLLVIAEQDSELARTVADHSLGYCAAADETERIASLVRIAAEQPGELEAMRKRNRRFAAGNCTADAVLPKWDALLDELASGSPSAAAGPSSGTQLSGSQQDWQSVAASSPNPAGQQQEETHAS